MSQLRFGVVHKVCFLTAILLVQPLEGYAGQMATLVGVEDFALANAPEMQQLHAQYSSLTEQSIAVGQLPDPTLSLGPSNVPTNSFSFTQDNMTQIQVGLMQYFPRGKSRAIKSQQKESEAQAIQQKLYLTRLDILRTVRTLWVNLYFWEKSITIYQKERQIFRHLLSSTQSLLANNQAQQKDVVRAQFELSALQQSIFEAQQQILEVQAQLSRWIGRLKVNQLHPYIPLWPRPPKLSVFYEVVKYNPLLKMDVMRSKAALEGIHLAEQAYKPGINVGVVYGVRQGRDTMNQRRSDFVGAQMTLALPVFTKNRQNREVKSREDDLAVAQSQEELDYRNLKSELTQNYMAWEELLKQVDLYSNSLVPQAKHYAEATLVSYQNKQTDFPTLARAYVNEYTTDLKSLKKQVALSHARINLLYLQGK